jgi:hypothetical protein
MVKNFIQKNCFSIHGYDKVGRPLVWMRLSKLTFEDIDKKMSIQYMVYFLDHVLSLMKSNVD